MFRVVKADMDLEYVSEAGLESMWEDTKDRTDIIRSVQQMSSREIIEALENKLDDNDFKQIMISLASSQVK